MKSKQNELSLSPQDKELLKTVSTLFGVKPEIVQEVWEYTFLSWLLTMKDDQVIKHFAIPYLGNIGIRFNNTYSISNDGDSDLSQDIDTFVSVNANAKRLLSNANEGDFETLANIMQEKLIKILNAKS